MLGHGNDAQRWKNTTLFGLVFFLSSLLMVPVGILYGPYPHLKGAVVGALLASQHSQWARYFLSEEEIAALAPSQGPDESLRTEVWVEPRPFRDNRMELLDVSGKRFTGKLLVVHDPTRVKVATAAKLGKSGEKVSEIARRLEAAAAVNGGGFADPEGKGDGSRPMGITIRGGEVVSQVGTRENVAALTQDGVLLVGRHSLEDLQKAGVKEAVSFGPPLIVDGKPLITTGDGGWGVGPRTAIGQRADGSILLLVVDGRQWPSVGATLKEVQDILLENGAVTATNLDGGSSSVMVFEGRIVTRPVSLGGGERPVPTAFIVETRSEE